MLPRQSCVSLPCAMCCKRASWTSEVKVKECKLGVSTAAVEGYVCRGPAALQCAWFRPEFRVLRRQYTALAALVFGKAPPLPCYIAHEKDLGCRDKLHVRTTVPASV